ncbi:MAG TPA: MFS transporter [Candidatus Bathyarchaeia archaeon]|nr:MFS transporter [Candidatus Bathyarchaeia archaeon]
MIQEAEIVQVGRNKRWLVLAAVLGSRTIYTINWFNIAPALLLIASDLRVDLPSLGVLTSSFLLGAGIFQIPAGTMSARWGAKNTSQLGMLILSLSGIGEGISPNFPLLVVNRFLLGIGAALFFAPAIGILTPLFREQEEGLVLGLYNSCFNIGGGIALFGWVVVIELVGWRWGLVFGGLIGLASVAISQLIIPKDRRVQLQERPSIRPTFRNRNIWIIAFGVLGLWGGIFSASSFLQTYMTTTYGLGAETAGLLASSIMIGSVFGGPIGGYLSDRYRRRKIFILVPGLGASIGILLFGVSEPFQLAFLIPIVGFLDAIVFSTMYASASQYPEIGQQYAPLGISIINCVQILGSFAIPIVFTLLVHTYGNYSPGWFFMGGLAIALILLILLLEEPFTANSRRASTS